MPTVSDTLRPSRSRLGRLARLLPVALLAGLAAGLVGCIEIEQSQAHARLLNASADYESLDLYFDDRLLIESVGYETASGYVEVDADAYTLEYTRADVTSTLLATSEDLDDESHTTFVAFGPTGGFATLRIDEDVAEPGSGEAKVQFVNAATDAGSLDVYLTDPGVGLGDVAPTFSALEPGAAADLPVTVDDGTYQLRITAAGSKTDLRYDHEAVTLASRSVTNFVVTGTGGGFLVNVAALPQRGAMSLLRNDMARVRVAAGITDAATVTVVTGDDTIAAAVPYTTLTGYQLVAAGETPLEILVNGTPVLTTNATLDAGADYTLLLYGTVASPDGTMLEDANRLPSGALAQLRLVNGMSGLGAAINAAVDYSPVIENVPLGAASPLVEIATAVDARIDVTQAANGSTVYSQTGVDFDAESIFTLVMFGGPGSTTGVLRKDR
jgi:hypothetical protein